MNLKGLGKKQREIINDLVTNPDRFIQLFQMDLEPDDITVGDEDLNSYCMVPKAVFQSLIDRSILREVSHYRPSVGVWVTQYKLSTKFPYKPESKLIT